MHVRFETSLIDELDLEGLEEALTDRVVIAVADSAHASYNAMPGQQATELVGVILTPLVGMKHELPWYSSSDDRHAKGFNNERNS
jgi:hypothetical protein